MGTAILAVTAADTSVVLRSVCGRTLLKCEEIKGFFFPRFHGSSISRGAAHRLWHLSFTVEFMLCQVPHRLCSLSVGQGSWGIPLRNTQLGGYWIWRDKTATGKGEDGAGEHHNRAEGGSQGFRLLLNKGKCLNLVYMPPASVIAQSYNDCHW